jgi:Na+/proline symporter
MTLPISTWDILVLIFYLVIVFGIGLYLSKRASRSTEEFFVSGRSLPWWIVGTSMVATTFAADTPLVVSGLVAQGGIYKNWLWWQYGIGAMAAVFLFSRLWRRAGITTDAELIELRYDGRAAAGLRAYRATWFGLFQNVLVIAWVMKAMAKIVLVVTGWHGETIMGLNAEVFTVLVLFIIAVGYTALSGLWGVVITDFLQFVLAMGAAVYLAVMALRGLGGMQAVEAGISANGFDLGELLRMVPRAASLTEANPFTEFLILIGVVWWASYSIDGGGYLSQRLFAAKDERHATLGFLWYNVAHIAIRPWPWIVVGLCGMAMFGALDDAETYYPMVMRSVLPPGLFGVALASFFAAFMSTIDTEVFPEGQVRAGVYRRRSTVRSAARPSRGRGELRREGHFFCLEARARRHGGHRHRLHREVVLVAGERLVGDHRHGGRACLHDYPCDPRTYRTFRERGLCKFPLLDGPHGDRCASRMGVCDVPHASRREGTPARFLRARPPRWGGVEEDSGRSAGLRAGRPGQNDALQDNRGCRLTRCCVILCRRLRAREHGKGRDLLCDRHCGWNGPRPSHAERRGETDIDNPGLGRQISTATPRSSAKPCRNPRCDIQSECYFLIKRFFMNSVP